MHECSEHISMEAQWFFYALPSPKLLLPEADDELPIIGKQLKGNCFMTRSSQRMIYYHGLPGQLQTFSNATEVAQRTTSSCTQHQIAVDNGISDSRSI